MSQKKSKKPESQQPEVRVVRCGKAPKLNPHASGLLGYEVGITESGVSIRVVKNASGGAFAKEWVSLDALEKAVPPEAKRGEAFHSSAFRQAIKSRSQNTPGFIAAALRQEGLLVSDPEKPGLVRLASDWKAWAASVAGGETPPPVQDAPAEVPPITDEQLLAAVEADASKESKRRARPAKSKGKKKPAEKADAEPAEAAEPASTEASASHAAETA